MKNEENDVVPSCIYLSEVELCVVFFKLY